MIKKELEFFDVLYFQKKVIEFNKVLGINSHDKQYADLYKSLSYEECFGTGELVESVEKGDMVGIADGLADSIFTVFQWAFLEGCEITSLDELYFYKVVKKPHDKDISLLNFKDAILRESAFEAQSCLLHLLEAYSEDMDVVAVFNRVLESNMSKAVHKSKDIDIVSEVKYIEKQGRYGNVICVESGDYFLFKAGSDIREGTKFSKPKLIKSRQFLDVDDLGGLQCFIY